ncbi:hypothetical protein ACQ4PT_021174 [Festuca glaucescens]
MSTEKRACRCSRTSPAAAVQGTLPVDLLLEIVALADAATVVRCAATGRILRRAILDPAFRRPLALTADGFDPALLLGVSYWEYAYSGNVTTHRVLHTHTAPPTKLPVRLDADSLRPDSFEPVASRDGLLLLRRYTIPPYFKVELSTCDTLTGHVTSLPPTTFPDAYFHVLLNVGDAGRSFELLVADKKRHFYGTFSSKDNQWSAIREVAIPQVTYQGGSYCSAVIGRTVYWPFQVHAISHWDHILALDVDSAEATTMDLPPSCLCRMMTVKADENLLLAAVHGRLCLLVSESRGIAMWTLTSSLPATWSRQVVVSCEEIARQAGLGPLGAAYKFTLAPISFEGFGERSGAVILNWGNARQIIFLRLDLGTKKEAAPVVTRLSNPGKVVRFTRLFLHEIDLVPLLQAMKSF